MSSKRWCAILLVLWTIAIGPSPTMGSGRRGEDQDVAFKITLTEVKNLEADDRGSGNNSTRSRKNDNGLRKSTSSASDFVIVKSSLGGDEAFSKVRRIRRETTTGLSKVHLSGGSYVYRPAADTSRDVAQNVTKLLTRIARAFPERNSKKGYPPKRKGYGYAPPSTTRPPPIVRVTTEENDSQFLLPQRPEGLDPKVTAGSTTTTTTTTEDPFDIRDNIPGEPGKDYSALASVPKTSFTCEGRAPGFYADVEAGCQVFHRCTDDPWYTGQVRVIMDSFLCPNGSLFNQQIFSCDWWGNTDCNSSQEFFELNEQIGQLEETNEGTVQYKQFTGLRVPSPPGTKKVAPGIVPKKERKPLPPEYKSSRNKAPKQNGRPLESDPLSDDELAEFFSNPRDEIPADEREDFFRPLNADTEEENIGSSQTQDEVILRTKKVKKSRPRVTTTPPPDDVSDTTERSEEELQEPSAATNSQSRPLVVNRESPRDRDEKTEAQTPSENLVPPGPEFDGDPVTRDDKRNRDTETTTPSSRPQSATPKQDYLPPRDEYLPPKDTGYKYPKPDNPLKLPGEGKDYLPPKKGNEYLPPPPGNGEYLSGTSPSTNQYLPPTTQRPGGEYLPPRDSYSTPGGLHTYSPTPDSYFRKPSSGYGNNPSDSYLPPSPPSRDYGQPNNNYLPPNRDYGTPNQPPSRDYGTPNQPPSRDYGTPNQPPSRDYGTPNQPPSRDYGTPNQPPSRDYGTPNQPPSRDYGTPNQNQQSRDYLPPNQSRDYLPPKKDTYGPPNKEYGTPNQGYRPNQGYQNPPPNNNYLPPPKDYGTPNGGNQGNYLPPPPPQNPNNQYLPPNNNNNHNNNNNANNGNQYLPPKPEYIPQIQPPAYSYGTPQTGIGYTFFPHQTTVTEHWPANAAKLHFEGQSLFDTFNLGPTGPGFTYGLPATPGTHYDGTVRNAYNGGPHEQSNAYLPPGPSGFNTGYSQQQQQPQNGYLPPNQQKPGDSYLPPQKPSGDYGPPRPGYDQPRGPNGNYLPPQPDSGYQQGQRENGGYPQPPNGYLPPNHQKPPGDSYLPPQKPSGEYGQPQRPSGEYGQPQKPSGDYGTPQRPSGDYGTPQRPSGEYGQPQRPSGEYGQPQRPSGEYGQPQRPSGDYGTPQRPSGDYGTPQRPSGDYGTPNNGPPGQDGYQQQRPGGNYGPPQQGSPSNQYLPPPKPDGDYGPPRPGNDYLPPRRPENDYLPPRDNNPGYNQNSQPPNEYGPPTTGGYSTLPDHILKDYNPSASPTPPTSYSTIPDQTPPPIYDSGQPGGTGGGGGGGLYTIEAPKIDIVSVPLVSYHSHVVSTNPILEFPPFKKR